MKMMPNTIQLFTGGYFNFVQPNPEDVKVEDIAGALSKTCRFGGHIKRFYSVAEHAINCSLSAMKNGATLEQGFAILHHDDTETYMGDMVKPLKNIMPEFARIEKIVERVIGEKLGIDFDKHHDIIKQFDIQMLFAEKRELFDQQDEWFNEPEEIYVEMHTNGLSPDRAYNEFLYLHYQLEGLMGVGGEQWE